MTKRQIPKRTVYVLELSHRIDGVTHWAPAAMFLSKKARDRRYNRCPDKESVRCVEYVPGAE